MSFMRDLIDGEYVDHINKISETEFYVCIIIDGEEYEGIVEVKE